MDQPPAGPVVTPTKSQLPAAPKPVQTASPTTIGMLSAGADVQAAEASTAATSASVNPGEPSSSTARSHASTHDRGTASSATALPEHEDTASAPVGLTAAGSTHNTSAAAGASGSVTCGGASASVLGLLESIFGFGDDRSGDLGPLANSQDHAWRMSRQPGFAPD